MGRLVTMIKEYESIVKSLVNLENLYDKNKEGYRDLLLYITYVNEWLRFQGYYYGRSGLIQLTEDKRSMQEKLKLEAGQCK